MEENENWINEQLDNAVLHKRAFNGKITFDNSRPLNLNWN